MISGWRGAQRISLLLLLAYAALSTYATLGHLVGLPRMGSSITHLLTLLAFSFALLHAWQTLGSQRAIALLVLTFVISLAFESVGVATGWIYGPYHYTNSLGPRVFGLVPVLIPVAWFMMMYPARVIAGRLLGLGEPSSPRRVVLLAALSAVVMTAWDVVMDPFMVRMGHWVWEQEGAYFGVPLQNYLGWLATTFTTFLVFGWWEGRIVASRPASIDAGYAGLAIWAYLITWASNSAAALQMGLGGPVLAGAFSAGAFACLALILQPGLQEAS
jgi:putative membrane protein